MTVPKTVLLASSKSILCPYPPVHESLTRLSTGAVQTPRSLLRDDSSGRNSAKTPHRDDEEHAITGRTARGTTGVLPAGNSCLSGSVAAIFSCQ